MSRPFGAAPACVRAPVHALAVTLAATLAVAHAPALAAALVAALAVALVSSVPPAAAAPPRDSAEALVASVDDVALAEILREVLSKNPDIAVARARAMAASAVAPQESALPDPMLDVNAYAQSMEGRQLALEYSQEIPGAGKRRFATEAAWHEAAAAEADVEAVRLSAITEARELWLTIAGIDARAAIVRAEAEALDRYEGLARSRYELGEGLQQDVVRLQAELTRAELDLVMLETERQDAVVMLNALRGRPGSMELPAPSLPEVPSVLPDADRVAAHAEALRPEMRAAIARIAAAGARSELARRASRPDVTLRAGWMAMSDRGEMGDRRSGFDSDEVMLGVGISLPVRGEKIRAGIEQAEAERQAAAFERDALTLSIGREAALASSRLRLIVRGLRLNEGSLAIQADETVRSTEEAYGTGLVGSFELLDSERELFEIRRDAVSARAEIAILVARLEGVLGAPLSLLTPASEGAQP